MREKKKSSVCPFHPNIIYIKYIPTNILHCTLNTLIHNQCKKSLD